MSALFGLISLFFREAYRAVGFPQVKAADMAAFSAALALIERLFADRADFDFIFHG